MLLLLASIAAWAVLEARVSAPEPHAHLPRELATGLALLAVHASAIAEHLVRGDAAPLPAAGVALLVCGIALRVSAIRTLGPAFVSTSTAPLRVVRAGPYRFMKHPSEIGLLAAAVGAAALLGSGIAAAVIALVLAPLVIVRCAAEDRTIVACAR
jgi:protein-S-isoprenylcysteine O-methyltransferase Ste14